MFFRRTLAQNSQVWRLVSNSSFTRLNSLVLLGPLMTSAPLHTFPVAPAPKASACVTGSLSSCSSPVLLQTNDLTNPGFLSTASFYIHQVSGANSWLLHAHPHSRVGTKGLLYELKVLPVLDKWAITDSPALTFSFKISASCFELQLCSWFLRSSN